MDRAELMTVEARLDLPFAAIELQLVALPDEIDRELPGIDDVRIDLSLTPRTPGARMSFRPRWPAHRFEALGRLCLVPPGETARARSGAGTQRAVVCFLRRAALDGWLDGPIPSIGERLDAGLDIRSAAVSRLMAALGGEAREPGFAHAAMCEALAMQLAVELGRYYRDRGTGGAVAALPGWRLALIDERLAASRVPPTLAELADLCGLSARHLTRAFRASRGCSIGAYLRDHQVETAKRALAAGESVKAIAHALGFSSRSSFSHAFQKGTGLSPQRFRDDLARSRRVN